MMVGQQVSFQRIGPKADSFIESRCPGLDINIYISVCLSVPFSCNFLGLSLALRSHDQILASYWLPPLPLFYSGEWFGKLVIKVVVRIVGTDIYGQDSWSRQLVKTVGQERSDQESWSG